jgi:hypothetical protein
LQHTAAAPSPHATVPGSQTSRQTLAVQTSWSPQQAAPQMWGLVQHVDAMQLCPAVQHVVPQLAAPHPASLVTCASTDPPSAGSAQCESMQSRPPLHSALLWHVVAMVGPAQSQPATKETRAKAKTSARVVTRRW